MYQALKATRKQSFVAIFYCALTYVISKYNCCCYASHSVFSNNKLFERTFSPQWTSETLSEPTTNRGNYFNETLLNKLLKVFGLERHAIRKARHVIAPQYMLDLYNSIAESQTGVTRTPNPYHANIVRSFLDKDSSHPLHFQFDIRETIPKSEHLLEAELHLYKVKPRSKESLRSDPRSNLYEVRVYQLLSAGNVHRSNKKLLDARRMSLNSVGWEVFYVKDAVSDWIQDDRKNHGLLITVASLSNEKIDERTLRFARRHHQHSNKQPILVVFTDDGRSKMRNSSPSYAKLDKHDFGYPELSFKAAFNKFETTTQTVQLAGDHRLLDRQERSLKSSSPRLHHIPHTRHNQPQREDSNQDRYTSSSVQSSSSCSRHELYVDFSRIGWSSWIISPKGYNAFFCKGDCNFPLGHKHSPTNHATVQSIVHELRLTSGVDKPCCVPNKLLAITLLYFDEQENVILKQYDDMVAESCGCH